MTMAKDLINRGEGTTLEDSLRIEALAQAIALGTDDDPGRDARLPGEERPLMTHHQGEKT